MKLNNYLTLKLENGILSLFFILIAHQVYSVEYPIHEINSKQGLSHGEVYSFLEDRKGNMWIGTIDGLNKYDGQTIKVLNIEDGLPNNTIRTMIEDQYERLWLGTDKGIHIYDPNQEIFLTLTLQNKDLNERINSFIISENNLWIGSSKGIYHLIISKEIQQEVNSYHFYPIKNVHELIFDYKNNKQVWAATNQGLIKLTFDTTIHIVDDVIPLFIAQSKIQAIAQDKDTIYCSVYGFNQGVYCFKKGERTYKKINDFQSIQSICVTDQKKLFIGSSIDGVYEISSPSTEAIHHKIDHLSSSIIQRIYKDKSGGVWIATSGTGVNYIATFYKNFHHLDLNELVDQHKINQSFVRALSIDEVSNMMFIGLHNGGLWSIDLKTKKVNDFGLDHQLVYDIKIYEDEMYICGSETFSIFQKTNKHWKKKHSIRMSSYLTSVTKSGEHVFWITSRKGLIRLERQGDQWTQENINNASSPKINHDNCRAVYYDSIFNELWVGMQGGGINILKLDNDQQVASSSSFTTKSPHPLSSDFVRSIYKQSDSTYYIGTYRGLNLIKRKDNVLNLSKDDHRFEQHVIQSITEDHQKNLWIGINRGLLCYSTTENKSIKYNSNRGLATNEFSEHTVYKKSNGELFFGTVNGIIHFDPQKIIHDKSTQKALVVQLSDDDKEQTIQNHFINESNHLKLRLKTKSASISKMCNLQYQLMGVDTTIRNYPSKKNQINYADLSDGDYTFRFRASNLNGQFADQQWETIPITIKHNKSKTPQYLITVVSMLLIGFVLIKRKKEFIPSSTPSLQKEKIDETVSSDDQLFLDNLYETIRTEMHNSDFSVESLEKKMGMSHANFYRKLKILTGSTAKNIIQDQRMNEACILLKSKEYRVSEVAYMVGFNDPKYFTKCFKKHYGELPSQYKQ
ncbi:two-component regulator propeller domain-containing protein [Flammeovirga pacifica]|nr:two-component regulator propeller domain-containing protein [Flammeovirga pacifica]